MGKQRGAWDQGEKKIRERKNRTIGAGCEILQDDKPEWVGSERRNTFRKGKHGGSNCWWGKKKRMLRGPGNRDGGKGKRWKGGGKEPVFAPGEAQPVDGGRLLKGEARWAWNMRAGGRGGQEKRQTFFGRKWTFDGG